MVKVTKLNGIFNQFIFPVLAEMICQINIFIRNGTYVISYPDIESKHTLRKLNVLYK